MMFRWTAVVLFTVTLPFAAEAQGADAFAGEWRNPKATGSIVEARVYSQGGRWMMQLFSSCQPNPCVWDPLPLMVSAPVNGPPSATANFSESNMRRQIALRLGEDSLVVTIASYQLAVPARRIQERRSTTIDELRFLKAKTEPLTPMRVR